MEALQPALIPNPMSGPAPPTSSQHPLRDDVDQDPSVSQSNLDALITAINSNAENVRVGSYVVDSQPPNAMSIQSLLAGSDNSAQQHLQNNHVRSPD